ncbi:hypothetical protein IQ260_04880 [Leptolyngbya cf. ectocarpi LEGE 11479]|uniref:Uncharacterized protein n=1 Tax=Leptolyngbya cf. ectocarpi LEGE 11479 TaxID=1828722 RepID=A0A928ZSB9_LEPEC|nr:hypothetical protein [Leptolyngbya ectocarpi]MBE9065982.1 hypothetical protein [Leptolyngbya cf. ectocarpi LEGE 11479]
MAYSDFTINDIRKQFAVELVEDQALFSDIEPQVPPRWLSDFLDIHLPLADAIGTEKAKSEFIVAPILSAARELLDRQISLFSGIEFTVDKTQGLTGRCDYIVSRSRSQYSLSAPVLALVETKNDRINAGLGQCMAEMIAAELFNHQEENAVTTIFGCVTTGDLWRFLKLQPVNNQRTIFIDTKQYFATQVNDLLGILKSMV